MQNKPIFKYLFDYDGDLIWVAFYLNGKKQIECFQLDEMSVLNIFIEKNTLTLDDVEILKMYEPVDIELSKEKLLILFPEFEDFSWLDEYQ